MKRTIILRDPDDPGPASPPPPLPATGPVSAVRCLVSLGCALLADGLQWLVPPMWVLCDGAMVVALLLIWGRRWEIAIAVIPEVIPGLDLFPTWTLFVGYLIALRRKQAPSRSP